MLRGPVSLQAIPSGLRPVHSTILHDLSQEPAPDGPERALEQGHLEPPLACAGFLSPGDVVDELRQAILQVVGVTRAWPGMPAR